MIEALREAIGGQLLVVETTTSGEERYAFRHALVQEVVYDELLPGERRLLHRAHAEALEARPPRDARDAAGYWAELAHHWSAARDDPRAFAAGLHAADAAEHAFAFEAALAQYECVLELWPVVPDAAEIAGVDRVRMLRRAAMNGGARRRAEPERRPAPGGGRGRRRLRPGPRSGAPRVARSGAVQPGRYEGRDRGLRGRRRADPARAVSPNGHASWAVTGSC